MVEILLEPKIDTKALTDLNKQGKSILIEASELTQEFRDRDKEDDVKYVFNRKKIDTINLKMDYFIQFDTTEVETNRILLSIYGHDIEDSTID